MSSSVSVERILRLIMPVNLSCFAKLTSLLKKQLELGFETAGSRLTSYLLRQATSVSWLTSSYSARPVYDQLNQHRGYAKRSLIWPYLLPLSTEMYSWKCFLREEKCPNTHGAFIFSSLISIEAFGSESEYVPLLQSPPPHLQGPGERADLVCQLWEGTSGPRSRGFKFVTELKDLAHCHICQNVTEIGQCQEKVFIIKPTGKFVSLLLREYFSFLSTVTRKSAFLCERHRDSRNNMLFVFSASLHVVQKKSQALDWEWVALTPVLRRITQCVHSPFVFFFKEGTMHIKREQCKMCQISQMGLIVICSPGAGWWKNRKGRESSWHNTYLLLLLSGPPQAHSNTVSRYSTPSNTKHHIKHNWRSVDVIGYQKWTKNLEKKENANCTLETAPSPIILQLFLQFYVKPFLFYQLHSTWNL